MTDHDALVRAICEFPDDDTPRLIYADFLEETGEAERAAFIRAQIELARTPAWEPFAVLCRRRRKEWSEEGEPFRDSLPELPPGGGLEWHQHAFRRGLGWRLHVRSLHDWNRIAPRLLESAPIGELDLNPPSIRDDWREFARGNVIRHLHVVHLDGMSPVEPIRALCESRFATGITDIHFHRASSPGLPELLEDLLRTPLGRGLKGLHFYVGYEALDYLIDSLASADAARLERLSFQTMGMTPALLDRLLQSPLTSQLQELDLANDQLRTGAEGSFVDWFARLPPTLHTLRLPDSHFDRSAIEALAGCEQAKTLKALDLRRNFAINHYPALFDSLREVRLLGLKGCRPMAKTLAALARSPCWRNLVELDLRDNRLTRPLPREFLLAPIPPNLTAFLLDVPIHVATLRYLEKRFGDRLV